MTNEIPTILAAIGLLGLACQVAAWLLKVPAILFLLLSGILVGPVAGWVRPDALFGPLLFPLISLLVAVILFEGSLTLRLEHIRGLEGVVRRMVSQGLLVTWATATLAAILLLELPWQIALLFGAIVVVTGPTVIVPMLRTVRPNQTVSNILRWEGIVIDPIGALLAVLVFEFVASGQESFFLSHTLYLFAKVVVVGVGVGALAGWGLGSVLRHHLLPQYLHNVATLTFLFGVFALSNEVQKEAGLLTVTVMGIWLANMRGVDVEEILNFKESLSLLFISGLFILLAARLDFDMVRLLGWPALGVLLVLMLVARPLKIMLCSRGSTLRWQERVLLAWIAPRGIVAAAIAALFALKLEEKGLDQAGLLVPLTFMVIIGTVLIQSLTARALAERLGVAEPDPRGFLIVGANRVARTIAKALVANGFRVLVASPNWDEVQAARMSGLQTYFGNPASEHADRHLDLVGIGRLLALSTVSELNSLAGLRYRSEFGIDKVYTLHTAADLSVRADKRVPERRRGYTLFGDGIDSSQLDVWIGEGAAIHTTQLTPSFDFAAYRECHSERAIPLFAIDPKGRIQAFVANGKMKPMSGWTILALVRPKQDQPPSHPVEPRPCP